MRVLEKIKKLKLLRPILCAVILFFLGLFQFNLAFAEVKIAILDSGSHIKSDEGISFTSLSVHSDPLNHGTKVSQIIRKHNPEAKIFMVQVCEGTYAGYKPDKKAVIKGINWAKEQKVDIINLSLNIDFDRELISLIEDVSRKDGIIFVAAAGNNSFQEKFVKRSDFIYFKEEGISNPKFPACLDSVISVGATDENGKVAEYSAKGADIYVDGRHGKDFGTSFAAAKVTGNLSRFLWQNPKLNIEDIRDILNNLIPSKI